ncbi:hypothetical protein BV898_03176 [Hypsibius exemplaris]|uniref:Uncharacterized protein n=1 Tax=Hypsibius exemplaris TaxID=2072580 RepID=A0A1W0X581_HYPEX|nr:hypothetical protein BV898_03176 [Hypsibius exemplaris]
MDCSTSSRRLLVLYIRDCVLFLLGDTPSRGGARSYGSGGFTSGSRTTVPGRRIGGIARSGGAAPPSCGASGGCG